MRSRPDDAGPNEPVVGPSRLAEGVLALLEEAGCPQDVCDQVVRLVEAWEYSLSPEAPSEPIPDDCLPPPAVVDAALRGPELDESGRIMGGTWHGMTPEEVLADRDAFNRACGE